MVVSSRASLHAFQAKQRSLALLQKMIQSIQCYDLTIILSAILYSINVELIESGKYGWKAHLQGAGEIFMHLLSAEQTKEALGKFVISDLVVFVPNPLTPYPYADQNLPDISCLRRPS